MPSKTEDVAKTPDMKAADAYSGEDPLSPVLRRLRLRARVFLRADFCGNWAVDTETGGETSLVGKAFVQVSTGEVKEIDLQDSFTEKGNRRTVAFSGVPPTGQGLSLLKSPPPLFRVLHMQEK